VSSASTIAPFGASIGLPFEAEWSPLFAGTSHAVSTLSGIVASMYPVFRRPCRN